VLDTAEHGYGSTWIDVRSAQDVRFTLDMSGSEVFPVYIETLDRLRA